jgi:hypothetical protein
MTKVEDLINATQQAAISAASPGVFQFRSKKSVKKSKKSAKKSTRKSKKSVKKSKKSVKRR